MTMLMLMLMLMLRAASASAAARERIERLKPRRPLRVVATVRRAVGIGVVVHPYPSAASRRDAGLCASVTATVRTFCHETTRERERERGRGARLSPLRGIFPPTGMIWWTAQTLAFLWLKRCKSPTMKNAPHERPQPRASS